NPFGAMPSDVARHFAPTRGVSYKSHIRESERLDESCQIVGVPIHVVPRPSLARAAVATPVVGDHTKAILGEEKKLAVPCIGTQRPPMRKRYDRAFAPVFVVDCRAILHSNCAHVNFLLESCDSGTLAVVFIWQAPAPERLFPSQKIRRTSRVWFGLH